MALAAAALSSNGIIPAPRIALSLNTPQHGWLIFSPLDVARPALPESAARAAALTLQAENLPIWHALGSNSVDSQTAKQIWYLAGSLPHEDNLPLALALVLEENDPQLARQIGETVLLRALNLPVSAP